MRQRQSSFPTHFYAVRIKNETRVRTSLDQLTAVFDRYGPFAGFVRLKRRPVRISGFCDRTLQLSAFRALGDHLDVLDFGSVTVDLQNQKSTRYRNDFQNQGSIGVVTSVGQRIGITKTSTIEPTAHGSMPVCLISDTSGIALMNKGHPCTTSSPL